MHIKATDSRRGSKSRSGNLEGRASHNRDGNGMKKTQRYHYTECGLNNVWLLNGFSKQETPYGPGVSIEHIEGLHKAIATVLVRNKLRWSGGEFRFIRKELNMSQKSLADIFGKDVQTVARWEKSGRVPKMADRFLRTIYKEHSNGHETIVQLVTRLNELDQKNYNKLSFDKEGMEWAFSEEAA